MTRLLGFCLILGVGIPPANSLAACTDPASFGAVPDDNAGDSTAIQQALDAVPAGGVVCLGSGTFDIETPLTLSRRLTLQGHWDTTLAMRADSNGNPNTVMEIPGLYQNPALSNRFPSGIKIERLTFDGRRNPQPTTGTGTGWFGLWVQQARNLTLRDLVFKGFVLEGLTVSNGLRGNENVKIERVAVYDYARMGIHIGTCKTCSIKSVLTDDQNTWLDVNEGGSGVGIDVEVEGGSADYLNHDKVDNLLIEQAVMDKAKLLSATGAISITPAYGPVSHVTVRNATAHNGGLGVLGADCVFPGGVSCRPNDIRFIGNWIGFPNVEAAVGGIAANLSDNITLINNRIGIPGGNDTHGISMTDVHTATGTRNILLRNKAYDGVAGYSTGAIQTFDDLPEYAESSNVTFQLLDSGPTRSRYYWLTSFTPGGSHQTATHPNFSVTFSKGGKDFNQLLAPRLTVALDGQNLTVTGQDPQGYPLRAIVLHNAYLESWMPLVSGRSKTVTLRRLPQTGDSIEVRIYSPYGLKDATTIHVGA